jgi:hypothetical protein
MEMPFNADHNGNGIAPGAGKTFAITLCHEIMVKSNQNRKVVALLSFW